jgi:hypothetical protein
VSRQARISAQGRSIHAVRLASHSGRSAAEAAALQGESPVSEHSLRRASQRAAEALAASSGVTTA